MILRRLMIVLCLLGVAVSSYAQQTSTTVARDPQAISILSQSLTVAGGLAAISAIQDATGTGTITYTWAGSDNQGTVTIYSKGPNEFRMDSIMPNGKTSLIINGTAGESVGFDDVKESLQFCNLTAISGAAFPAARLAAALTNSSTGIAYRGLVTINDSQVYELHVAPSVSQVPNISLRGLGEFDVYIDPSTSQLLEIADVVTSAKDVNSTYIREIVFSNPVSTNGLSIPFAISEKFDGQIVWSVQLSSIALNSGISDSLFSF
jgi:outer membrane lipoprotein-sorting protein